MTIEQRKKFLIEFLTNRGAYTGFVANIIAHHPKVIVGSFIIDLVTSNNPQIAIGGAFPWDDSPEGPTYWSVLREEFVNQFNPIEE